MERTDFSDVIKRIGINQSVQNNQGAQSAQELQVIKNGQESIKLGLQSVVAEVDENTNTEKEIQSILQRISDTLIKQFSLQEEQLTETRLLKQTSPKESQTTSSDQEEENSLLQQLITATKEKNNTSELADSSGSGIAGGILGTIAGLLGKGTGILGVLIGIAASIAAIAGVVSLMGDSGGSGDGSGGGSDGGGYNTSEKEGGRRKGKGKRGNNSYSKDGDSDDETPRNLKGKSKSDQAMNFFMEKGWSKEDASAIVGNLRAESGDFSEDVISGKRKGDKGTAAGIAQWRGDRQDIFKKRYGEDLNKNASFLNQLDYVDYELKKGRYKNVGKRLKEAKTIEEKTGIVNSDYEVSRDGQKGIHGQRIKLAKNTYDNFDQTQYAKETSQTAKPYDQDGNIPQSLVYDQIKSGKTFGKDIELPSNLHIAGSAKKSGFEGVDPALLEGIAGAAKNWKGTVDIFSSKRVPGKGEKKNHSSGHAVDIRLYDEHGKEFIPKKDWKANGPGASRKANGSEYNSEVYKTFMQDAVAWGSQYDPRMSNARWGGNFKDVKDDWMHLDTMYGKGSKENTVRANMGMSIAEWRKERFGIDSQNTTQTAKPKESATRVEEEEEEEELNEPIQQETARKEYVSPDQGITARKEQIDNFAPDVYQQTNVNDLVEGYGVSPFGGGMNQPQRTTPNYPSGMGYPIGGYGMRYPSGMGNPVGIGMGVYGMGRGIDFKNNPIGSMYGIQGIMRGMGAITGNQNSPILEGTSRAIGNVGQVMQAGQIIGRMGRFSGNSGILSGMHTANAALGAMNGIFGLGKNIIGGLGGMFGMGSSRQPQTKQNQTLNNLGVSTTIPSQPPTPTSNRFGKTLTKTPTIKSENEFLNDIKVKTVDPQPIPTSNRFGKTLDKTPTINNEQIDYKGIKKDLGDLVEKQTEKELTPTSNRFGKKLEKVPVVDDQLDVKSIKKELNDIVTKQVHNEEELEPTSTRFGKKLEKVPMVENQLDVNEMKKELNDITSKQIKANAELIPNQTTRGKTLEGMTVQTNIEKEQQMSPSNAPPPIINVNGGNKGGGNGLVQSESGTGVGSGALQSPSPDSVMGSTGMTFRSDDPTIWHIMYGNARSV